MTLLNLLENIDMSFDAETIKVGLFKLRELFDRANELRNGLHHTETSPYSDLSDQVSNMIHILDSQKWDAKNILDVAADIKCSPDGSYHEWDEDTPMPDNWEEAVREKLELLGVK